MENDYDFEETFTNFALIISGELDDIKEFKKGVRRLAEINNLKIVYQKQSVDKLWVSRRHQRPMEVLQNDSP